MKRYMLLFVCLISTNALFGQANYAVPDIPAASILNIENTSVSRVSTPKEVAISFLPLINSSEDKPFGLEYNFSKRFNIPLAISIGEISKAMSFGVKYQAIDDIQAANKKLTDSLKVNLELIESNTQEAEDESMAELKAKYPNESLIEINNNHQKEKIALVKEIIAKKSSQLIQDVQEQIKNIAWNKTSLSFAIAGAFYGQTDDINTITVQDRTIQGWINYEQSMGGESWSTTINATGKHRYIYGSKNNSGGVAAGILYGSNQIKLLSDLSWIVNTEEKPTCTLNGGGEFVSDKYLVTAKFGYDFINKQWNRRIEVRLGI